MKKIYTALLAASLVAAIPAQPVLATNGMDMIGYSARSSGMGGADVAVDADATAVSGNPALIAGQAPRSATIGVSLLMPKMGLTHNVPTGPATVVVDEIDGEAQYFPMPTLGYVHKIGDSPVTLGLGLYAQGGMGVDFQDVSTGMGTKDELTSNVSFMRLNPILAYRAADWLSLGATVMVGYAQAEFSMYPETSYPGVFAGMDVTDLSSMGYAGRVGAQVKLGPMVRLGATYTSESSIDLDNGTLTMNFGSMGGKVDYDVKMGDFSWPQEAEAGIAVLPFKGLTVAADVKWINWSATIDKPTLTVSGGPAGLERPFRDANGNPSDTMTFDMAWDDQIVYAIGAEYAVNETHTLRAGFNYGKNPVPDDNLNPLFPAIVEKHATLGYGLNLGQWVFDLAYEYAFENKQTNNNANQAVNPFGPGLEVTHSQSTVHAELSYRY
jgi:long-chain fatty acid transport protein